LGCDAQAKSLGTDRSIEEMARNAGWRVRIVPRLSVADGINAVRTLFPRMWFDQNRCADGVQALGYYRYEVDPNTGQFSRNPLHDAASNGADALRYVAVAMQKARRAEGQEPPPRFPRPIEHRRGANLNWMSRSPAWPADFAMAALSGLTLPLREPSGNGGSTLFVEGYLNYRCYQGAVMGCAVGANLNCGKANVSTRSQGGDEFCRANSNAQNIPMAATGHDTIFSWRCAGTQAVPVRKFSPVDDRGFEIMNWKVLN
jgi:hypothetical protein